MGRVSLIVDGYNEDARELFEIPEGIIALIHNSAVQKIEADDYE